MVVYDVFYNDVQIGVLYEENRKHKFEAVTNNQPIFEHLKCSRDWGEKIPFFESRIYNAGRFNKRPIAYHNDGYALKIRK